MARTPGPGDDRPAPSHPPRLTGLSYEYLAAAMRAFAADERTNNLDMPRFMRMLTERERNAIARYLSAL